MCGIFGLFGTDRELPASADVLEEMARALFHRGPDGGGVHRDGALGIGMRRLSIIDLDTGSQPIANEDGTVWVVFNGEIYNYRELRSELTARGHRFATASDTEVIVHLWEELGERCVERLRGMFALAVWDATRRTLLLARDRLGIKPLYYADTPRGVVFGSEIKALLESPWIVRNVDRRATALYLERGYVPDPLSILEGVSKLPPGHTLIVRDGRIGEPRRYWSSTPFFATPFLEGRAPAPAEAEALLWERLTDAVRSHLVSDVPLGAFLSGGVDSTTVVAIMAQEMGARVKTFSIGFREPGFDELPYAREVAQAFGTEHHELLVGPEDLGVLDDVLAAFDEPFSDCSAIPTYIVSRLARQHVTVALSGDGGDELFAGYERYLVDRRRRLIGLIGDSGLGAPLRRLSTALPPGTRGKNYLYNLSLPRMERYMDAVSLFPARELDRLLDGDGRNGVETSFNTALREGRDLDPLSRLQDFDIQTYLPGDILTKLDRMSMAVSLEARVPLLDHPLVEFACGLPAGLRMRGAEAKYLLKRVLRGRVPDAVLTRPKQGFGVPLAVWFSRILPTFFSDRLGVSTRLREVGVRDGAVQTLLDLYEAQRRPDHCGQLWGLLVLDSSLRRLLEPRSRSGTAASGDRGPVAVTGQGQKLRGGSQ
jgi:asparagine synthase (glutamine-hydrolysing)